MRWDLVRSGARAALVFLAVFAFVHAAFGRRAGELSVQSEKNLNFVRRAKDVSLAAALDAHPAVRPPLYPLVLWTCASTGIPARRVNELLLDATLVLLFVAARRNVPGVDALWLVALYAVFHFNYTNLFQVTSEALFLPLCLLAMLLVQAYGECGRRRDVLVLGLTGGALGATRYFAFLFAIPLLALHVLTLPSGGPATKRVLRVAVFCGLSLLPAGLWMAHARTETGYLTGAERFAERHLPAEVAHWKKLVGVRANAVLWIRTVFLDFLSLHRYGALSVTTRPYAPSAVEWSLAGLGLVAAAFGAAALLRQRGPPSLSAQIFVAYNLAAIAIGVLGNNDPLYSRFLYPSYVFGVLWTFEAYAAVKRDAPRWQRVPFVLLCAAVVGVHVLRHVEAVALPYR